ncbi:23627_t:CDS:2 [Cetraspora pellucida]|uniref:23627_t:CDS:1 n=1 Tax=Cetraspora pellucida TaxID=1433469 RepID=A0A9N9IE95_9GLOM|nr:23627_t:CDS:2 [Cetraspora pellucida]
MTIQIQLKVLGFGYISHYSDLNVLENLNVLQNWLLDNNIKKIVHHAYKQAIVLARDILKMILNTWIYNFITISNNDKNEIREQPTELQRNNNLQTESIFISIAAAEVST